MGIFSPAVRLKVKQAFQPEDVVVQVPGLVQILDVVGHLVALAPLLRLVQLVTVRLAARLLLILISYLRIRKLKLRYKSDPY